MAGNGDLIRSLRGGGRPGMAAAQELLRRAQAGAVTPAELHEVQKVVTSPELRDAFRDIAGELGAFTRGGPAVYRDVDALLPDTDKLTDARELPERFLADLTLVQGELLNHPGMTRGEKAERLYAFFEAYAGRFAQLAHGTAQTKQAQVAQPAAAQGLYGATEVKQALAAPLTEAEFDKTLAKFDKALTRAGFQELRADDGRTGLEVARQLLQARTPEAQREARPQKLDAPGWKDNVVADRGLNVDARRVVDAKPQILVQAKTQGPSVDAPPKKDETPRGPRRSDKVLGGHMLWNALHLLRGEDLDDVAKKDAMTQLAVAAGLLLGLMAILIGLLVWL